MEAVFAQARDAEAASTEFLVDDGWKAVEAGPELEPVVVAEEPAQPQGRNGKPQPSSLSLFEWALSAEEEREKEPVGAGR